MTTCAPRRSLTLSWALRPLSLAAVALSMTLAGCATAPNPTDTLEPPPQITQVESDASTPPAARPAEDDGRSAIGQPEDPLNPGKTIQMQDQHARDDLWARIRNAYSMPDLEDELVLKHEAWYADRPDYFERMTGRGSMYLFHIVEELQRRKMPTELALLPFIESAFNPKAISSAKASGMWQFMPATGRTFALKQNMFQDDRRNVLASTNAALDYLTRLHGMFGDWHLALAAYNWGEGNVSRAIARNVAAGLPTDYASLRMPAETRNYVPKLQAMKNLVGKPAEYGLTLPALQNHPYFVSVPIERDIDVTLAARLAGLSVDDFKALNPQMNKPVILAAGTPQLLLPYDNADRFIANLAGYRGGLASWTAWTAPRTMKITEVASSVGMSESTLREINHVPPRMMVRAGSTLLVARSETRGHDVPMHVANNAHMALTPEPPPFKRVYIEARKGDNLVTLARRYGLSANQLAQWNHISTKTRLKRGQDLAVVIRADAPDPVEVMPDPPARKDRRLARDEDKDDHKSAKSRRLAARDEEEDSADARKSKKSSKTSAREEEKDDHKSTKSRKHAARDEEEDSADSRKSKKSSKASAREEEKDDRKSTKSRKLAARDEEEDRADAHKSRKSSKASAREEEKDGRKAAKSRKHAARDEEEDSADSRKSKKSSKASAREEEKDDRKSAKSRKQAAREEEDSADARKSKKTAKASARDDDKEDRKSAKSSKSSKDTADDKGHTKSAKHTAKQ